MPGTRIESLPQLALVNSDDGTLLRFVKEAARSTSRRGSRRHVYVLTCYFDLRGLHDVVRGLCNSIREKGGTPDRLSVAIDAGEWIRCRQSVDEIADRLVRAARLDREKVQVIPVHVPSRLLHAKAYAAVRPGSSKGFVVVTSGNATRKGLGIDGTGSNLELASLSTEPQDIGGFAELMTKLLASRIPGAKALKHDAFLMGLALLSRGAFYHRWQGSLGTEVRFKLTLTETGKDARRGDEQAFPGYESDSDTISRDPLNMEAVFVRVPKPFPQAFWRTYAVDTLLGYWLPAPIASLVDEKLSGDVAAYVEAISKRTSSKRLGEVRQDLERFVGDRAKKGWIKERPAVVATWAERVRRLRENTSLIKLRIHPYQRVPDLLDGESRQAVLELIEVLKAQLRQRQPRATKAIVDRYLSGELSAGELDSAFKDLVTDAKSMLART